LGSLTQAANGKLYGMTSVEDWVVVVLFFPLILVHLRYTTVKDFGVTENGSNASAGLVQASDGNYMVQQCMGKQGSVLSFLLTLPIPLSPS